MKESKGINLLKMLFLFYLCISISQMATLNRVILCVISTAMPLLVLKTLY